MRLQSHEAQLFGELESRPSERGRFARPAEEYLQRRCGEVGLGKLCRALVTEQRDRFVEHASRALGLAGKAASSAAASSEAPQLAQKRNSGGLSAPHEGQACPSRAPHEPQKRAPSGFSNAHAGQRMRQC
jgi:glycine/D-amino acid oxidase-like deaminating enzyme